MPDLPLEVHRQPWAHVVGADESALPRLRILMVASEGPPTQSGMARTVQRLADGFQTRNHRVDVVSYPQVRRLSFGEVRLSGLLFKVPEIARRVHEFDVIHVHGAAPTFTDVFLAVARSWPARPPVVYTHHCDVQVSWGGPLNTVYNALHRQLAAGCDELVSTTRGYAAQAGLPANTSVIPLGVDGNSELELPIKDDGFTVLFVGQFRPYKGVPVLLRALAHVHGARLLVAGGGPQEHLYRQLAAQLGIDVEFHVGAKDEELRTLYRRAHVLVLPSITRAEAFGLVLLESMAAGCVPVASDLAGVRDVLGRIGFTFPAHSVEGLAETLRRLRDNPELTAKVGIRARRRAAEFTWERTLSDYERLFRDLVAVRQLRRDLQEHCQSHSAAVRNFVSSVAANLQSGRAEIVIQDVAHEIHRVASTCAAASSNGLPHGDPVEALGRYACESGEGILLSSDNTPSPLANLALTSAGAAMAAPLTANDQHFGALVVMRAQAFDARDLQCLSRVARYASPILHT